MEQDLPKAIQEQLDKAAEIEKQIADEKAASDKGNTDPAPAEPQPAPEPTEVPTEPQPADEPKAAADDEWKKRYNILQGKYNAEVPKLHDQVKGQTEALQNLQKELELLKQKPQEPQQPKQSLVTEKDEETFGSDLVDLARRVSREENDAIHQRIGMLEQAIQQLLSLTSKVSAVEKMQVQTVEERFWNNVSTAVPDWQDINTDERWLAWLAEYDLVAGKTRQESLDEASASLDSPRVIGLFNLWKTQFKPAAPSEPSKTDKELSRQVAPPKQGASTQPAAEKIWSLTDYERAFDPRLRQSMSEQEIDALQADADKAMLDGRVR